MVLLPENLSSNNDVLIANHYEIVNHGYDDEFHIVVYYIDLHHCKVIIRRLDSDQGWGLNLQVKLLGDSNGDHIITIGSSNNNLKIQNFYTEANLSPAFNQNQKIPKCIIQTYSSVEAKSLLHYNAVMSFIELNPEYEYKFFDNQKCREFILKNFPQNVLDAYDILKPRAFRADLFRACYLYIHGGCYFDHKFILKKRLQTIIEPHNEHVFCIDNYDCGMYNAIMLTIPKSPILKNVVDNIVNNVLNRHYGRNGLAVSGPDLLWHHTKHLNAPLKHIGSCNVLFQNQTIIKAFRNIWHSTKEDYGQLWNEKLVFYSSYTKTNGYIVLAEPYSKQVINTELVKSHKSRLQRTKTRIIEHSRYFALSSERFEFQILNRGQLQVVRVDLHQGWTIDLQVKIINNNTHYDQIVRVGPSNSNTMLINYHPIV